MKAQRKCQKATILCHHVILYSGSWILTPDSAAQRQVVNTDSNCLEREGAGERHREGERRTERESQGKLVSAPSHKISEFETF